MSLQAGRYWYWVISLDLGGIRRRFWRAVVWSAAIVRRYCSPVEPTFEGLVRVATVTIGFRRVGVAGSLWRYG